MIDREKVIKGLEQFIADFKPFCGNKADWQRVYDALALLESQEPVEPKTNDVELAGLRTWEYACPECNCILIYRANYCSCCGRAVKWDG